MEENKTETKYPMYLTTNKFAKLINLETYIIRKMCADKLLPCIKIGKAYKINTKRAIQALEKMEDEQIQIYTSKLNEQRNKQAKMAREQKAQETQDKTQSCINKLEKQLE